MLEIIRVLRKKQTDRYYLVNCVNGKTRVITKRGAIAVCRVFNVEVEDYDVLVRTK